MTFLSINRINSGPSLTKKAALVIVLSLTMACSEDHKDDHPSHLYTPQVKQLEELTQKIVDKTWSVVSVTRAETDITSDFSDFTITFTGEVSYREVNTYGTYTAENGLEVLQRKAFGNSILEKNPLS